MLAAIIITALGLVAVVAYLLWIRRFERTDRDGLLEGERRRQAEMARANHRVDASARDEHERARVEFDRRRADANRVRQMNEAITRGKNRWRSK